MKTTRSIQIEATMLKGVAELIAHTATEAKGASNAAKDQDATSAVSILDDTITHLIEALDRTNKLRRDLIKAGN